MSDFFIAGLDARTFYEEHWRRRPVFVRGGARALFPRALSYEGFEPSLVKLQLSRPALFSERNGTLFAQHVESWCVPLAEAVGEVRRRTRWPLVWFDAVAAPDGGSIGRHYDDSDNFVFQQEGYKRWRLSSPERIPEDQRRDRMLDRLESAAVPGERWEGEEIFECELGPADVLYIPLLWLHEGVSVGQSFSVSLVCGAQSALDVLLPRIARRLEDDPRWWGAVPLPTAAAASESEALDGYLESLFASMGPGLRRSLLEDILAGEQSGGGTLASSKSDDGS